MATLKMVCMLPFSSIRYDTIFSSLCLPRFYVSLQPPQTFPSTPVAVASRPSSIHSLGSSSHRSYRSSYYAPRKSSPLAEGAPTSRPSSVFLTPPDSPNSLSFTDTALRPPTSTHSKSLPARVRTVHRPATAPYSSTPAPTPAPAPDLPHKRSQSTSYPTVLCSPVTEVSHENSRQLSALSGPQTPVSFRPVRPSTSRAPEENWMTSESAPRFSRESLLLGAVVLPVRKHDAQQHLKRQSTLRPRSTRTHAKYDTVPNIAIDATTTPAVSFTVDQLGCSKSEIVVEKKDKIIPSVHIRIEDVDGSIQHLDHVGLDLSSRDRDATDTGKPPPSLAHVRKLTRDLAAKMKLRSGQVKPTMTVIQEKGPDPVHSAKHGHPVVESGGRDPKPARTFSNRTRSIWGYVLGSTR